MTTLTIKLDGAAGPKLDADSGVLITLSAAVDSGSISTYNWVLTPPEGSTSVLSDPLAASPTFTPDLEGSYQIECGVYLADGSSVNETTTATVPTSRGLLRIPGYEETVEASASYGWAGVASMWKNMIVLDRIAARGGTMICVNDEGASIDVGQLVHITGSVTPTGGEEIPQVQLADDADPPTDIYGIVSSAAPGALSGSSVADGALCAVTFTGAVYGIDAAGAMTPGNGVYRTAAAGQADETGATPALGTWLTADGAWIDGACGMSSAAGVQTVWVGKHGDDSLAGTSWQQAVLTIGQAITLATAMVPGAANRIVIRCDDAGIYTENFTIPQYVELHAPSATISGNVIVSDHASVDVLRASCAAGVAILKDLGDSDVSVVRVRDRLTATAGTDGLVCRSGTMTAEIENLHVANTAYGIGSGTLTMTGDCSVRVGRTTYAGTAYAVFQNGTGTMRVRAHYLTGAYTVGVQGGGTLIVDADYLASVNRPFRTLAADSLYVTAPVIEQGLQGPSLNAATAACVINDVDWLVERRVSTKDELEYCFAAAEGGDGPWTVERIILEDDVSGIDFDIDLRRTKLLGGVGTLTFDGTHKIECMPIVASYAAAVTSMAGRTVQDAASAFITGAGFELSGNKPADGTALICCFNGVLPVSAHEVDTVDLDTQITLRETTVDFSGLIGDYQAQVPPNAAGKAFGVTQINRGLHIGPGVMIDYNGYNTANVQWSCADTLIECDFLNFCDSATPRVFYVGYSINIKFKGVRWMKPGTSGGGMTLVTFSRNVEFDECVWDEFICNTGAATALIETYGPLNGLRISDCRMHDGNNVGAGSARALYLNTTDGIVIVGTQIENWDGVGYTIAANCSGVLDGCIVRRIAAGSAAGGVTVGTVEP